MRPRAGTPHAPSAEAAWAVDLALLRDAQASMVAGNPARAGVLAARVAHGGPFDGEREALILIADCRTASGEADYAATALRAKSFVVAHEGSPLAARVRAACTSQMP